MLSDEEAIAKFALLEKGWLRRFTANSWWAFYGDEKPLGPLATEAEASRAGLGKWDHVEDAA
jgi:hypothetical protein